jgi:hypothetical protein
MGIEINRFQAQCAECLLTSMYTDAAKSYDQGQYGHTAHFIPVYAPRCLNGNDVWETCGAYSM